MVLSVWHHLIEPLLMVASGCHGMQCVVYVPFSFHHTIQEQYMLWQFCPSVCLFVTYIRSSMAEQNVKLLYTIQKPHF